MRRSELPVSAVALAKFLIGTIVVSESPAGRCAARIVETEAYVPGDAASHAFRGETQRNRSLFMAPGHAYVYFIYGNYYCLNVSAESEGIGGGVLVRAAEPLLGLELMRARRGGGVADRDLCRGPGRLTIALAIERADDGVDLCARGALWLAAANSKPARLGTSVRIGLTKEVARPLRFFERGSGYVSGPARLNN